MLYVAVAAAVAVAFSAVDVAAGGLAGPAATQQQHAAFQGPKKANPKLQQRQNRLAA